MTQLHKRWDGHAARARDGDAAALAEIANGGLAEPPPALPPFAAVVGALHDRCYDDDATAAALAADGVPSPELRARVAAVRRWLATRGRDLCWIESRRTTEPPDPVLAAAAADALDAGGDLDSEAARAARAAAYGVDGGPALRALLAIHDVATTAAAVRAHLADGSHPLRDRVLASLDAP